MLITQESPRARSKAKRVVELQVTLKCVSMLLCSVATLLPAMANAMSPQETPTDKSTFQVGTSLVDVSPIKFPVPVNGGMTVRMADRVESKVHARCIVLAQGEEEIAIVVVDSCMMPRELLDGIKRFAEERTGIPRDHMMISATHTHTAPAAMSCLGTDADPEYQAYLRLKIADAIVEAQANKQPAKAGWATIDASNYMAVRRWIRRTDRPALDPFGNPTVLANMHAASNLDDVTGESGPEDPSLSLIVFASLTDQPIAVLSNLSMHYFSGVQPISADYFGLYCNELSQQLKARNELASVPLTIMSHGCSGDIWRRDYSGQTDERFQSISIEQYTSELVDLALRAIDEINYEQPQVLSMREERLPLKYRVPDAQRLKWAQDIVAEMGDRLPQTQPEIYAREAIYLHEMQQTEVVVQAIRIGDIAIATTPTETYALTGLKIKLQSPSKHTMVLDLANGGDGYIPPPEQHLLGGYNTWPARSAGLEVAAEPRIVQAALGLLEATFERPRRVHKPNIDTSAQAILSSHPIAYWRLDDFNGPIAKSALKDGPDAVYEDEVAFFLAGPKFDGSKPDPYQNRAVHLAGGRLRARIADAPSTYRIQLWVWNGMPNDAREISGWFYSRGVDHSSTERIEQLGIGGTSGHSGKLILKLNGDEIHAGKSVIERWSWRLVTLERTSNRIRVYLDGSDEPEIDVELNTNNQPLDTEFFFGGSNDGSFNWEGRLDEIAILPVEN